MVKEILFDELKVDHTLTLPFRGGNLDSLSFKEGGG